MLETWGGIIGILAGIATVVGVIPAFVQMFKKNKTTKKDQEASDNKPALNAFGDRENVEKTNPLDSRVNMGLDIKEIRVMNFAGTTILSPDIAGYIGLPTKNEMSKRIENLLLHDKIKFTIIINAPDSPAAKEAVSSEKIVNQYIDFKNREQVFYMAYAGIHERIQENGLLHECYANDRFRYRVTDIALPYALFQVRYKDTKKDHIKLDLYSPYIPEESKRRTMFIYKESDPENYKFFEENFDNVYNHALSLEEEKKLSAVWLEKAKSYCKKEF